MSNVTMLPYRGDSGELAQWLASADALVHAGTRETFGLVALEAMACGRPVVATRAAALPELVDERVGVLAEPLSAVSMAAAIAHLYERDHEAMGAAARARVLARHTWTHTFQAQITAYANLAVAHRISVPTQPIIELGSPTS
jgi:alpha-1,6-mannosyltransferase